MQTFSFHGIDVSNEISLLEYGLLVSDQLNKDGSKTHFCVYAVHDGQSYYDTGHISESSVNGYVEGKEFPDSDDIAAFLDYCGITKEQWYSQRFVNKLADLINYWGYENIMGTTYNPMSKEEAIQRYLK